MLARLQVKYEVLAELRARRDAREGQGEAFAAEELAARGGRMRELAREFPGALRELEASPATLLVEKARRVAAAQIAGGAAEPWMTVVIDFHAALREVLVLKHALAVRAPRGVPSDEDLVAVAEAAAGRDGRYAWPTDAAALLALRSPTGGRIMPLLWTALAARHGQPPATLERWVFGVPWVP